MESGVRKQTFHKITTDLGVDTKHLTLTIMENIFLHKVFTLHCSIVRSNFVVSKTEREIQRTNN